MTTEEKKTTKKEEQNNTASPRADAAAHTDSAEGKAASVENSAKKAEANDAEKKPANNNRAETGGNAEVVNDKRRGGNGRTGERSGDGRSGERNSGRNRRQSAFNRTRRGRAERPKSEFETKVLSARRVSRVVAGGRRFSLSVAVAVGNGKGQVGIGTGKGPDMAAAMEKARNQAQKHLVRIRTTSEKGIPCESVGKYCASVVHIRPAKGFVAGGAVRSIAELAGIQYINAKIQSRSKNHLNNARAAMRAFAAMTTGNTVQ